MQNYSTRGKEAFVINVMRSLGQLTGAKIALFRSC
ncbi:hypothetical protein Patl1_33432 [Pistacia atlantica]|uniref:Uncharacterized protein n=1 Tax=Pistacia atlantica TaxID=434234 RepID=A0ACC0ZU98_9ROSI|nr:hypothetical protein Patl1_33432 [Pistacia atlantica]